LSTISVHIEHLLGVVYHWEVRSLEHAARPSPTPRLLANPSLLRRRSSRRWTQRCASSCRRWASPPAGAALPPALSAAGGLTCARGLTCACSWRPHMRWPRSCLPAGGLACASALLRHGLPRVAAHEVWLPESAHQRLSYRPPCTCAIERAASRVLRSASLAAAFTHLGVRWACARSRKRGAACTASGSDWRAPGAARRAVRALHFSGASGVEAAVAWIMDHEGDADLDAPLLVPKASACDTLSTSQSLQNMCTFLGPMSQTSPLLRHGGSCWQAPPCLSICSSS